jgi:MoaA/NifB/PqqE/SkfB family radical SAM enzyme
MSVQSLARRFATSYREISAIAPPFKPWKAYANWARANYEMWARAGAVRARPLKLTVDPTNICQLRCPLCPTGYQVQDRKRGHANLHVFEHLIQEVGDYLFFIDFFNWGEPLLSPQLTDLVALAHDKGITTNVSSNLSLKLSDERIRRIVTSGLSGIVCSIDGTSQETYGTYRRGGKFDLAFGNMRRIIEIRNGLGLRRPVVTWQFLVFRFNQHEREKAARMAREIGTDRLTFLAPYLDQDRFALSPEDVAQVRQWTTDDPAFNRYDATHPEYVGQGAKVRDRCDWHYISTAINWDGTVAPCCTVFSKKDDFGRLNYDKGDSYMSIVNNAKFRSVRDQFAGRTSEGKGLVCERCPTPSLMGYASHVNRRIVMLLLTQVALRFQRGLGLGFVPPKARALAE